MGRTLVVFGVLMFAVVTPSAEWAATAETWSRKQLQELGASFTGRTYYLLAPALPLLMNDPVRVESCKIRRVYVRAIDRVQHAATLRLRGTSGAPSEVVTIEVASLKSGDR